MQLKSIKTDNLTQVIKKKKKKEVESLEKLWDVSAADVIITIQASRFLSDKKEDDIKFYENQKGPWTAKMMGRDKQFVVKSNKKKLKLTAPAQAQSSANQDDFKGYSSDMT